MSGKRIFRVASLLMMIYLMALVVSAQDLRRQRRVGHPTRQGSFSGTPIVGGSLADGIRGRRRRHQSALIGAGAGADGGTAFHEVRHNRRGRRH